MILTVTLNPAIDVRYNVTNFNYSSVNRVEYVEKTPGGKGLNVSRVLKILGLTPIVTGLLGGSNGSFIKKELDKINLNNNFFEISGETRNCIAILDSKATTEILEPGPLITTEEWTSFLKFYRDIISNIKYISISGSLPKGLSGKNYRELIEIAMNENKKVFFDSSGENFVEGIKGNPFFIKPNIDEIEYFLERKIDSWMELLDYKEKFNELNIENILITLGAEGALFFSNNEFYKISIPKVQIKNSVGSGDSTVAGFIHGVTNKLSLEDTLKYATACGTSNAMEETTGKINLEIVESLKDAITVEKI